MTSTRMVASLVDSKQGSNIKWIVFNNALNGIFSSLLGSGTLAHAFNNLPYKHTKLSPQLVQGMLATDLT